MQLAVTRLSTQVETPLRRIADSTHEITVFGGGGDLPPGTDVVLLGSRISPGSDLALAAYETRRLCIEADERGVKRLVLLSTLSLFDAYPRDYLIDEWWKPLPGASSRLLGSFLQEETARHCSLELGLPVVVLRVDDDLSSEEAADLVMRACERDVSFRRYRYIVIHASSASRFHTHRAKELLEWEGERTNDREDAERSTTDESHGGD